MRNAVRRSSKETTRGHFTRSPLAAASVLLVTVWGSDGGRVSVELGDGDVGEAHGGLPIGLGAE